MRFEIASFEIPVLLDLRRSRMLYMLQVNAVVVRFE